MLDPKTKEQLEKQHYHIVGAHSGVKLCHWSKFAIRDDPRVCYKQVFYGIDSHRCLQMTPTLNQCNQKCIYCWRLQDWSGTNIENPDDPEFILDEAIKGQRRLSTGYKGNKNTDMQKWEEMQEPSHVAISLTGEPTFYSRLGEFIEICRKRGMITFLVTNGSMPEVLENLDPLPTQLYLSVDAPNESIYKRLCIPWKDHDNRWGRILESLDLLQNLDCRTVVRHTLLEGWNIDHLDDFASLDARAQADFIEAKAYVFVGSSRQRMTLDNMPSHSRIQGFAKGLADKIEYEYLMEKADSRVVLLGNGRVDPRIQHP